MYDFYKDFNILVTKKKIYAPFHLSAFLFRIYFTNGNRATVFQIVNGHNIYEFFWDMDSNPKKSLQIIFFRLVYESIGQQTILVLHHSKHKFDGLVYQQRFFD